MNSSLLHSVKNKILFSNGNYIDRINMWDIKCSELASNAIAHGIINFKREVVILRDPDIYKDGADRIITTSFGYILPNGIHSVEVWVNPNEALAWGYAMVIDEMEAGI